MLCVTLKYINGALVIRKMLHLTVRDVVLIAIREMILPNTTQYICFFFLWISRADIFIKKKVQSAPREYKGRIHRGTRGQNKKGLKTKNKPTH